MAAPKRYDDFSKRHDLATNALMHRGRASDYGFNTVREGDLLKAKQSGLDLKPHNDQFGFPIDPRNVGQYSTPRHAFHDDLKMSHPSPRHTPGSAPKPRP